MNEKDLEQIVRKAVMDVLKGDDFPMGGKAADRRRDEFIDRGNRIANDEANNPLVERPSKSPAQRHEDALNRGENLQAARNSELTRAERLTREKIASLAEEYMNVRGYDTNAIEKRASIVEEAIKSTNINADDFRMYANKYFR